MTVVVSAANSAARRRSRPSNSAARGSRVPDQAADGMSEAAISEGTVMTEGTETRGGAARAAKAREELAAVPSQESSGDVAVADDLDADADLDDGDLDGAVDLEDFGDLDEGDLGDDALDAEDLESPGTPEADLSEDRESDEQEGDEPEPAAPAAVAEGVAPVEGKAPGDGGDDEIFVFGDDDDDLPAAQVAVA
ncbi:MAG: hypothetical protein ACRDYD_02270, partial [Acidimicrobiales bacterium]